MSSSTIFELKFRVWHIPQIPMKSFNVEVPSYAEAVRLRKALTAYDLFQYNNNIKPDYCNASGIQFFDHTLTDQDLIEMELDDRWVDIESADDLQDYIAEFEAKGYSPYESIPVDVLEDTVEMMKEIPGDVITDEIRLPSIANKIYQTIRRGISDSVEE